MIVQEYAGLDLTFAKDKLPAMSGLVKEMQRFRSGRYLAGIWESDLFRDLTWRSFNMKTGRCSPWRAPTWSWASVTGKVCWDGYHGGGLNILATFVKAECIPASSDSTGELSSGYLVLAGGLFATTYYDPGFDKNRPDFNQDLYSTSLIHHYETPSKKYTLYPDFPLWKIPQATVRPGIPICCLKIARTEKADWQGKHDTIYLILKGAETEPGAYERVGLLETSDEKVIGLWHQRLKEARVKIV
jgi:hypothetical protein